jgi:hypothetical protein
MHIEWTRFLAYPFAVVMWTVLAVVLAPVSMAIRRWMPDSKLKRLLLTDPYRRVDPLEGTRTDSDIRADTMQQVVRRLPSPK